MRFCLAAIAATSLLVGCLRGPEPPLEPNFTGACTLAGCESQVRFQLSTDLLAGVRYQVDVCLDDECHSEELFVETPPGPMYGAAGSLFLSPEEDSITLFLEDGDYSGAHQVSLTVTTSDGEPVARAQVSVELERSQPNGPNCEPVCWFAEVIV